METRLNNLNYAICNIATDLQNIDFSQIGQSSAGTIRRSLDDTLFVIKYNAFPSLCKILTLTHNNPRSGDTFGTAMYGPEKSKICKTNPLNRPRGIPYGPIWVHMGP